MKDFYKNSRRIDNEIFILYMANHELMTTSNFFFLNINYVKLFIFVKIPLEGCNMLH